MPFFTQTYNQESYRTFKKLRGTVRYSKTNQIGPGSVFTSEEFKTFCQKFQIKHVTCPVRDHRGNGKIEPLTRTLNERLRTNRNIILKKDKSGLSEILYALRKGKKADGKSPFEKLYGREPNTVKSNIINKIKNVQKTTRRLSSHSQTSRKK